MVAWVIDLMIIMAVICSFGIVFTAFFLGLDFIFNKFKGKGL